MKSIYEERPWLKLYPSGVNADVTFPSKSVGEVFDDTTEKWKNRTAIIFYGNKISFKELREMVDRFATALVSLGIRKGDRVALLLLNSPEYIISFYAAVKIGVVITPISPVYVSSEIKHQLEDSGAESIICQDILYESVEKSGVKLKNVILTSIADSLPKLTKFMGKSILRGVYQKMAAPSPEIFRKEGFYNLHELIEKSAPNPPKVEINTEKDLLVLPYTGGDDGAT